MNANLGWVLLALGAAAVQAKDFNGFQPAGAMLQARTGHTAALLADGRVLIAGGSADGGALQRSVEVFDPVLAKFTRVGDLPEARSQHSATVLRDGRVLIAGGRGDAGSLRSSALFDPVTGQFTRGGDLAAAQVGHAATLLDNGRVLIVGGLGDSERSGPKAAAAEVFDPATGAFAVTGEYVAVNSLYPPARGPIWPRATLLRDSQVLISGNLRAEIFDAGSGRFRLSATTADPVLAFGSFWHSSTLLADGDVLIAGGADDLLKSANAQRFDPETETFAATGSMSVPRALHTATLLRDGSVLIVGGETWITDERGFGYFGGSLASAERYDPQSGTFRRDADMRAGRAGHTATLLRDGRVLIVGGTGFAPYTGMVANTSRVLASAELHSGMPIGCARSTLRSNCLAKGD